MMTTPLDQFLIRAEALLLRVEAILPPVLREQDWKLGHAFRWRKRHNASSYLQAVTHVSDIGLSDLHNIGPQKAQIEQNTRQFVQGRPANNVLLTGARGTGKSSLIKACLNQFADDGLNAGTAHTDASADRINAFVAGKNGDLGAHTCVARCRFNFQQALFDLRYFELEQFHDEFWCGA